MFNDERSYVYNKAFARYFDNNDAHRTITGGLAPTGPRSMDCKEYESRDPEDYNMPPCCNEDPCREDFTRHTGLNDFTFFTIHSIDI